MKHFTTIYTQGKYSIDKDNYNDLYAVFVQCKGFKQQISNWYILLGYAYKYLNKRIGGLNNEI